MKKAVFPLSVLLIITGCQAKLHNQETGLRWNLEDQAAVRERLDDLPAEREVLLKEKNRLLAFIDPSGSINETDINTDFLYGQYPDKKESIDDLKEVLLALSVIEDWSDYFPRELKHLEEEKKMIQNKIEALGKGRR